VRKLSLLLRILGNLTIPFA